MEITVRKGHLEDEPADAVLLIHCEGETRLPHEAAAVDARLRGRLAGLLKSGEFTGRLGQVSVLHVAPGERMRAKRVVLAGLGKRKDASLEKLRQAAGSAAKAIRNLGATSLAVSVQDPAGFLTNVPAAGRVRDVAQTLTEGVLLGLYQFTTYRTERKDDQGKAVRKLSVVVGDPRALAQAQQGIRDCRVHSTIEPGAGTRQGVTRRHHHGVGHLVVVPDRSAAREPAHHGDFSPARKSLS